MKEIIEGQPQLEKQHLEATERQIQLEKKIQELQAENHLQKQPLELTSVEKQLLSFFYISSQNHRLRQKPIT